MIWYFIVIYFLYRNEEKGKLDFKIICLSGNFSFDCFKKIFKGLVYKFYVNYWIGIVRVVFILDV